MAPYSSPTWASYHEAPDEQKNLAPCQGQVSLEGSQPYQGDGFKPLT
jgi:hypothetical protein